MDPRQAVKIIAEEPLENLTDAGYLRTWLRQFGLGNPLRAQPPELQPLCDTGLKLIQNLDQLADYLAFLAQMSITLPFRKYLEIGVYMGGTFLVTLEYLRRFNENTQGYGIDIKRRQAWGAYDVSYATFWATSSQSAEFQEGFTHCGPYELVFVDGDHSYEACAADCFKAVGYSNMVVLHDIADHNWPGVRRVWAEMKDALVETHHFCTFTQQQPGVKKSYFGIGIAWRKEWRAL